MERQKTLNWQSNLRGKKQKMKKYHSIKRMKFCYFQQPYMDLENVMLSKINQTEKILIVHGVTYTWN